jgi:multicomponent K+:H+ antiporter subunit G
MSLWAEILIAALVLIGAGFALIGSWGLAKLRTFYTRMHGPTKATTLGVGSILIASAVWFSLAGEGLSLHELLVTLFLFLTAPVSAQLLMRVAMRLERQDERPPEDAKGGR